MCSCSSLSTGIVIQQVSFVPHILYEVVWGRPLLGECQKVVLGLEDEDRFVVAEIEDVRHVGCKDRQELVASKQGVEQRCRGHAVCHAYGLSLSVSAFSAFAAPRVDLRSRSYRVHADAVSPWASGDTLVISPAMLTKSLVISQSVY